MNADYLFKRLGYQHKKSKMLNYEEYAKEEKGGIAIISFDGNSKTIMNWFAQTGEMRSRGLAMTPQEVIAIAMKVKELRWDE